jgi:hypothetical protein
MSDLYTSTSQEQKQKGITKEEIASVYYHDIFDYPLSLAELIKWRCGKSDFRGGKEVLSKKGFYFLEGRERLVYKRLLKNRISEKKMAIAKKTSNIISLFPTVKMVGVTGSLAMKNSGEDGDIDLFVITKKGSLWTTRLLILLTLKLTGIKTRRFNDTNQKDKVCLNMWIDESDLIWGAKDRNIYTAHEIAQIIPLINKDKTYEKFLEKNKCILNYWPSAVRIKKLKEISIQRSFNFLIEELAFRLQYLYMKGKISRETVTKTKALFHPQNWGKFVLSRLEG